MLVGCDFSGEMVGRFKKRMAESEFSKIDGNVHEVDSETDYINAENMIDLDRVLAKTGGFNKFVYGC